MGKGKSKFSRSNCEGQIFQGANYEGHMIIGKPADTLSIVYVKCVFWGVCVIVYLHRSVLDMFLEIVF